MVKCFATIILDKSGSMQTIKQEAIEFFNGQLTAIKEGTVLPTDKEAVGARKIRIEAAPEEPKQELEVTVSLVTFNHQVERPIWLQPAERVSPLMEGDYICNGSTALYDAIAETIEGLEQADDTEEAAHLIIVVTDGQENCSQRFRGKGGAVELKQMIERLKGTGRWTFAFLGSGQDLPELQKSLGAQVGNVYGAAGSRGPVGAAAFDMASQITRGATVSYLSSMAAGAEAMSVDAFYGEDSLADPPEDEEEEDKT